jgi:phosphomannomutase
MSFFKAYDMRGTFGVDFDLNDVYKVGAALPKVVGGKRWLVGRDCRSTSDAVKDALVSGLCAAGAEVTDMGKCTTPAVYFFTSEDDFDGSVMVTASHNPPTDNGLKVSKKSSLPVGYANGLSDVEKLVKSSTVSYIPSSSKSSQLQNPERYINWLLKSVDMELLSSLRIAVDCSNGMSALFAEKLFPNAMILNGKIDGTFPAHSPNPLKEEAREQLSAAVKENNLDCGVIFDGDADRAMFVDENGVFIQPDYLTAFIARATLRHAGENASKKIIHDVRTSRGTIEVLREEGFETIQVPVGHAFAKVALRENNALCGGELAGHYYFSEFHNCDSGALAALRILEEAALAKKKSLSFSEMVRPVSSRYANSGEMNFKVEDKDAAIKRILDVAATELPNEISRSNIDGVRIEYENGWINVRKSNTEPYLRLIVECKTKVLLDKWVSILQKVIEV